MDEERRNVRSDRAEEQELQQAIAASMTGSPTPMELDAQDDRNLGEAIRSSLYSEEQPLAQPQGLTTAGTGSGVSADVFRGATFGPTPGASAPTQESNPVIATQVPVPCVPNDAEIGTGQWTSLPNPQQAEGGGLYRVINRD